MKATWMLGPIPSVSDSGGLEGTLKSAFLTSSQVKLVQLFQEPHPENHWSRAVIPVQALPLTGSTSLGRFLTHFGCTSSCVTCES